MGLTERQKRALAHDRHVALRAGAGSGKTMVLTERYLSILESGSATVDNIIAITFTEMAAAEMKSRIMREVRARISGLADRAGRDKYSESESTRQGHSATTDNVSGAYFSRIKFWETTLDSMSDARVSTIHSLCASLLRDYPLEADVDPEFVVLDDTQQVFLLRDAVDEFIGRAAEDGSDDLLTLSRLWSRRQIADALEQLFNVRHKSLAWAKEFSVMSDQDIRARHESLCNDWINKLRDISDFDRLLERMESLICTDTSDRAYPMWETSVAALEKICGEGNIPPGAIDDLSSLNFSYGSKKKWAEDHLQEFKSIGKVLREWARNVLSYRMNVRDYAYAAVHRALARTFLAARDHYEKAKGCGRMLDFDDLQEKTRRMLKNHPSVARELRRQYRFIMVDEFQDTNQLQWEIISLIARDEQGAISENVFLVGDEKQSIYAFRGADVRVFDRATRELDANNASMNIDSRLELDVNFRSHPDLIQFFNVMFEKIFASRDTTGLLPHITCENIRSGREKMWRRVFQGDKTAGMNVGDTEKNELSPAMRVHVLSGAVPDEMKENYASRHEFEAEMAACHLSEMLRRSDEFLVMDKENESARPLRHKDIAVLFRARTHITEYEEAFRREGIDFLNVGGFGFYERQEVADLMNILGWLADPRDEVSLAGALRSPMFGLSDETLFRISRVSGRHFFDRLKKYVKCDGADDSPAAYAVDRLRKWSAMAGRLSVPELILRILEQTGLLAVYSVGEHGLQKRRNIEKFIDIARSYEREYSAGILSFVQHLEEQQRMELRLGEAPVVDDDSDAVRFMTIHGSKGLEFPVVVVVSLGDYYHRGGGGILSIEDFGEERYEIGFRAPGGPDDDFGVDSTAVNNVIKDLAGMRETDEMKRLLYVACTRAEDYLVLSGYDAAAPAEIADEEYDDNNTPAKKWSEEIEFALADEKTRDGVSGYVQWIMEMPPAAAHKRKKKFCAAQELIESLNDGPDEKTEQNNANDKLKYLGTPGGGRGSISVSVTELQDFVTDRERYRKNHILKIPTQWTGMRKKSARGSVRNPGADPLTRGSAVHRLFESIFRSGGDVLEERFENILINLNVSRRSDRKKLIDEFLPKAKAFLESDLGAQIEKSVSYAETPFLLKAGDHYVNGKIDMLYGGGGTWHIIDYKTDKIRMGEEAGKAEEYKMQLEIYALAAMKGLAATERVTSGLFFIETGTYYEALEITHVDIARHEEMLEEKLAALAEFRAGFS